MPKRSLNLSLDGAVIERARRYCERHDTSISRLVSDFLSRLPIEDRLDKESLPPRVRRLVGVAAGADEAAYRRYLIDKHGP
jgi:hypothetical protein